MTPQLKFILKIVFFIFLKNIATRNEVKRFFGRYQQRAFEKSNSPAIYSLTSQYSSSGVIESLNDLYLDSKST